MPALACAKRLTQCMGRAALHPACRGSSAKGTDAGVHAGTGWRGYTISLSSAEPRAYQAMPLYYSNTYTVMLPEDHRFPMERYKITHDLLKRELQSFQDSSKPASIDIVEPVTCSMEHILLAHDESYVTGYINNTCSEDAHKTIGFPWSPEFVTRTLKITGATVQVTHVCELGVPTLLL
jgi:hypothetical protein